MLMGIDLKLQLHENVLVQLFDHKEQLTFFDIGACEGLSSMRYLSIFPEAKGYAFEPIPNNFKLINKNITKFKTKSLQAFELGLSSKKGEATFYVSSGNPEGKEKPSDNSTSFGNKSSSLFKPAKTKEVHKWLKFKEAITINTETLFNFCSENKINTIDFIHMDVQGAELMVLEGANDMIYNINAVWLEVEKIELYENQALKDDIENFMENKGFMCLLNKINHIAGDQLWVKKIYFDSLDDTTKSNLNIIRNKTELKSKLSSIIGSSKDTLKNIFKG